MPKQKILEHSTKRYEFIHKRNDSYNEETWQYEYDPPEIDQLGNLILKLIKEFRNDLEFEFIIEELTKLGQAPCLLYDDDGRFAIAGSGFQDIPEDGGSDINIVHFIEKELWKPTIREALNHYLDE